MPIRAYRASPALGAPNGWPYPLATLVGALGNLAVVPALPLAALWWLVARPPLPLSTYLIGRFLQWARALTPVLFAPEPLAVAASVQKPIIAFAGEWDTVTRTDLYVPPAPRDIITTPEVVVPQPRPAFMLTPEGAKGTGTEPAAPGEKAILYLHGGGYTYGHPLMTPFPVKIARDTKTRVLAFAYRRCVNAEQAWPAPLLDALAVWLYITEELRFPASAVVALGDSAGAHLALALATQLGELRRPVPGGLALCSPWGDMTLSMPAWERNAPYDYISRRHIRRNIASLARHLTPDGLRAPVCSPALAPAGAFAALAAAKAPVFISVGTIEVLEDDIRAVVRNLRGDGVDVTVFDDIGGIHGAPLVPAAASPGCYERFAEGVQGVLDALPSKA